MASALQTKILRRAKSPEDYAVYRAALEWGLTDPIVIESRDDFKSEYRWKDRLDPFPTTKSKTSLRSAGAFR
jgi:hypothetical protein